MIEYGVFNDEGCLVRQLYRREDAETEAAGYRAAGDEPDAYAAEMCPDHADEEQPRDGCELCDTDEDEDEGPGE